MMASLGGHFAVVDMLLRYNARVDVQNAVRIIWFGLVWFGLNWYDFHSFWNLVM